MKAKDTVIKVEDLTYAILLRPDLPMGQAIAEEQAKVSFKAGRLSMAGEIVEWTNSEIIGFAMTIDSVKKWQAKVKEWLEGETK